MNKIRILIADQLKLNRDKWSCELNNDPAFEVIADCNDVSHAMQLASEKYPGTVLLEITCMGIPNFDTIPPIPLSSVKEMIRMGAKGYQVKGLPKNETFLVIVEVTEAEICMIMKLKILFLDHLLVRTMITVKKVLFQND